MTWGRRTPKKRADLKGKSLWVRHDELTMLSGVTGPGPGDAILAWPDLSGQGTDLATVDPAFPFMWDDVWAGIRAVRFDGADYVAHNTPAGAPTSSVTGFMVISPTHIDADASLFFKWGTDYATGEITLSINGDTRKLGFGVSRAGGFDAVSHPMPLKHREPVVVAFRRTGVAIDLWVMDVHGDPIKESAAGGGGSIVYGATPQIVLGTDPATASYPWVGDVFELMVLDHAERDRQVVATCYELIDEYKLGLRNAKYFGVYNGVGPDAEYCSFGAYGPDLLHMAKLGAPLVTPGPGIEFDSDKAKEPSYVPSEKAIVYTGHESVNGLPIGFGVAFADTAIGPYEKYTNNPVVERGLGGAWDAAGISFPNVRLNPDQSDPLKKFVGWYAGTSGDGTNHVGFMSAPSLIGPWTGLPAPVIAHSTTPGAPDRYGIIVKGVMPYDGKWHLYAGFAKNAYAPGSTQAYSIWLITVPFGSEHLSAAYEEPLHVASPRPSAIAALTADCPALSRGVVIANSSIFETRELLMLRNGVSDDNPAALQSAFHFNALALVLADSNTTAYNVADGATVQSAHRASVFPASVIQDGDGFVLFATPFEQFGGAPIRELTTRYFSTTTPDEMVLDHGCGQVIKYAEPDAPDEFSAENFDVHLYR